MFVVSIFGGLGSQMDQYAFYLALRNRYPNVTFKFEINILTDADHNGLELEKVFGLKLNKASIQEIIPLSEYYPRKGKFYWLFRILNTIRHNIWGWKESWITPDDPSRFYSEVFNLNPLKSYLFYGNWGNEKYHEGIESKIKEAFKFPAILDKESQRFHEKIKKSNSVSIHVRHGDYYKFKFPIMPIEYYYQAISIIERDVDNPHYFIFSDDEEFIKDKFANLKNAEIVTHNKGEKSYIDMHLMSQCKHNIIANSTFSFWAARLNQNPNKIVIAPRYHVSQCKYPIALSSWILLDNNNLSGITTYELPE